MPKSLSKVNLIKNVTIYSTYILLVWAFYRFLFRLPDSVEELIIKPVIWLLPIIYFVVIKEKNNITSLGITFKNLFPSIYLSIGLGSIFVIEGVLTNFLKYGKLSFAANIGSAPFLISLGLSLATSFSEEISFRGYIFSRLSTALNNDLWANVIQATIWTAIHVPIAFFIWNYTLAQGIIYLAITAVFGLGSAFIFSRTKNIFGSIFLHVLWEWPIILFR